MSACVQVLVLAPLAVVMLAVGVLVSSCSQAIGDPPPSAGDGITVAAPAWAAQTGVDQYGHWADVTVDGVTQRLRFIAPGTFTMGSSDSETGRDAGETLHPVTLTSGYWLADSPCTQALWTALMHRNPSYFTGDAQLPVEQLSCDEVARFLTALNARVPGAGFLLPSEAQWEYACRAGSATACGPAPLDDVGWYQGNAQGRSHAVKTKAPNAWGLWDMHGEVWNLCADVRHPYTSGAVTDPVGRGPDGHRIIRGGSWSSDAAACRSARRSTVETVGKCGNAVGFRVAAPAQGYVLAAAAPSGGRARAGAGAGTVEWPALAGSDPHGDWADLNVRGVTQRMRWIPPGRFIMGSPPSEKGRDSNEVAHEVVLTHGFWLADSACTQALWHAVMHTVPAAGAGDLQRPKDRISWMEVQGFMDVLNRDLHGICQLPSEAQREYACRASASGPFAVPDLDVIAWYRKNSGGETHAVKRLQPNAWGLYDMEGNVWEWCADWYGPYPVAAVRDPVGPDMGTERIIRGGCWRYGRDVCRSAYRDWLEPERANGLVGFRLCIQALDP